MSPHHCWVCCCDLQTDDALGDHAQTAQSGRVIRQTFAIDGEVLVKWCHREGVHNLQHQIKTNWKCFSCCALVLYPLRSSSHLYFQLLECLIG